MRNFIITLFSVSLLFLSCEVEKVDNIENAVATETEAAERGPKKPKGPKPLSECIVVDLDRCDLPGYTSNFWWPEGETNWTQGLFHSDDDNQLTFTEYDDGTANIKGSTVLGDCVVEVDVWLKDKKDWTTFSNEGGSFKDENNDCTDVDPTLLHYYVIDSSKSTITATGGSCYEEGTFGVEQRPDPDDLNTPHFGVIVGPGGGLFDDANKEALGLSTWGWLTDQSTGERKWIIDFNFNFECEDDCETAFAKGDDDDSTCFLDDGFSRWGWTIEIDGEGEYTYDVYAGAGQCDTDKGELVGTVTVEYAGGNISVDYDILEGYTIDEEHTYAGEAPYPTKNGADTVAPGQYTIAPNLSGKIYVILHTVICED